MKFRSNSVYHVFNRGNNKQPIFYNKANFIFFIQKIRNELIPLVDMFAYCLMPNHFHLLFKTRDFPQNHPYPLNRKIGTLQSSYTRAINVQEKRSGSLFQQKTKAIEIFSLNDDDQNVEYLNACFHYIHQNPLRAGLVKKMEDWEYSSFRDYAGERRGTLVNKNLAQNIIGFNLDEFYKNSTQVIDERKIKM